MVALDQLQLLELNVRDKSDKPGAPVHARARYTSVEICAGAGGAALGVEQAGFKHLALVEIDKAACETLRLNRPNWNVLEQDLHQFGGWPYFGIDLLSGGVPCPPFSKAGLKQGLDDERDLFPEALRLVEVCKPRAVMLENVPGLMEAKFASYRAHIIDSLIQLGYIAEWRILQAADFGVPQLRPRVICVGLQRHIAPYFTWPKPAIKRPVIVGKALSAMMASAGWEGAAAWAERANKVGPTLVGGSKKHGGPDLGPTRARNEWEKLGVNGLGLANEPPPPGFEGLPINRANGRDHSRISTRLGIRWKENSRLPPSRQRFPAAGGTRGSGGDPTGAPYRRYGAADAPEAAEGGSVCHDRRGLKRSYERISPKILERLSTPILFAPWPTRASGAGGYASYAMKRGWRSSRIMIART